MAGFAVFCIGFIILLGGVGAAEQTVTNIELLKSFFVMVFGLAIMYLGVKVIEGK